MNWDETVKAQHQTIQKNTALYVTIVGLVITAVNKASFVVVTYRAKDMFIVAVVSILLQLPLSEFLLNVHREANWEDESGDGRWLKQRHWQKMEKPTRRITWLVGLISTISLAIAIGSVIQNSI
jgi:Co/Zn/Cd efflux system component